jgi:hypothetical protein
MGGGAAADRADEPRAMASKMTSRPGYWPALFDVLPLVVVILLDLVQDFVFEVLWRLTLE